MEMVTAKIMHNNLFMTEHEHDMSTACMCTALHIILIYNVIYRSATVSNGIHSVCVDVHDIQMVHHFILLFCLQPSIFCR